MMLAKCGMNLTGFPQEASDRLYKAFVRPKMEYGLQLKVLDRADLRTLQLSQNLALRAIFSVRRTTSTKVLHKLLGVESMALRNQVLNIGMAGRLINSRDSSIPAVNLSWEHLGDRKVGSFSHSATLNPLWAGAHIISRLKSRRRRGLDQPARTYTSAAIKALIRAEVASLDEGLDTVAGRVRVSPPQIKLRLFLRAGAFPSQQERVTVLRWQWRATPSVKIFRRARSSQDTTHQSAQARRPISPASCHSHNLASYWDGCGHPASTFRPHHSPSLALF